ncbi:MAG TPA: Spy/CpxP family protein refolding chaperone [Terriglobia bacterium]|jgi:Spy/CpxP family protein refolding chaperone
MKRILCVTVAILTLSAGAFAQRGNPGNGLKNALGLTDAQVSAIKSIVQNAQPTLQADQAAIRQDRQTFNTLVSTASPVAQDIGNAAIALHTAEAKQKADETALLNQVKQQLTTEQLQKLDTIQAAGGGRGQSLLDLGRQGRGPRGQ